MHGRAIFKGADGCKSRAGRGGDKLGVELVFGQTLIGGLDVVSGSGDGGFVARVGQQSSVNPEKWPPSRRPGSWSSDSTPEVLSGLLIEATATGNVPVHSRARASEYSVGTTERSSGVAGVW